VLSPLPNIQLNKKIIKYIIKMTEEIDIEKWMKQFYGTTPRKNGNPYGKISEYIKKELETNKEGKYNECDYIYFGEYQYFNNDTDFCRLSNEARKFITNKFKIENNNLTLDNLDLNIIEEREIYISIILPRIFDTGAIYELEKITCVKFIKESRMNFNEFYLYFINNPDKIKLLNDIDIQNANKFVFFEAEEIKLWPAINKFIKTTASDEDYIFTKTKTMILNYIEKNLKGKDITLFTTYIYSNIIRGVSDKLMYIEAERISDEGKNYIIDKFELLTNMDKIDINNIDERKIIVYMLLSRILKSSSADKLEKIADGIKFIKDSRCNHNEFYTYFTNNPDKIGELRILGSQNVF
jgi:hypothetical protein